MVIEKVFPHRGFDHIFKFLAFLKAAVPVGRCVENGA
jgi:hypothetical protein